LGSFKMEPQKQAKHSKSLDPDEIEEVLMDEELEDEVMEPHVQSSSSSEDEDDAEETEVAFRAARAGDLSIFFNFTGPPYGINRSAASDINAESSPFSIFILFFRQVFQIILTETNRYFQQYMSSRTTASKQEENVTVSGTSRGRPSPMASQLSRLEVKHSQHWPYKGKRQRCRVCSLAKQTRSTWYFCRKRDVGLCIGNCFEKWHTHVNL